MQRKRCVACGQAFHPRAQSPGQCYCSLPACQRERRRRWQRARRHDDPAYQENQTRAQRAWVERHPDYWREYRRTHPEYSEGNRARQQERDVRRREGVLAKMDAWTVEITVLSTT